MNTYTDFQIHVMELQAQADEAEGTEFFPQAVARVENVLGLGY